MKDGDYIEHLFVVLDARLPAVLLQPRQGLPLEGLRAARGVAHREGPRARQRAAAARGRARSSPCSPRATSARRKYLVFATRKGMVKKTEFQAYNTPIKADGIIAINIRDDDELVAVRRDERRRRHHHGLALGPGGALRRVAGARPMGRDTARRPRHERLAARATPCWRWTSRATTRSCSSSPRTATASARRSASTRSRAAATMGVKTIKLTDRKGALAGALVVREHQELVFISRRGMVQRTGVRASAATAAPSQGVRVMNMKDDDRVSRRRPGRRVRGAERPTRSARRRRDDRRGRARRPPSCSSLPTALDTGARPRGDRGAVGRRDASRTPLGPAADGRPSACPEQGLERSATTLRRSRLLRAGGTKSGMSTTVARVGFRQAGPANPTLDVPVTSRVPQEL